MADRLHIFLSALLLFAASTLPIAAQEVVKPNLIQITTHPEADLSPRISPDGKWMAFVSKQFGNYDIWIKNLETGRIRRMTDHQADDYYPVWDRKNRYLIFVSQRSDAKGDLWRLNLRNVRGELIAKGKPERLTTYLGFDGFPTISEYDEHIAWVSDRTGQPEIWFMTKRAQAVRQLTHGGATHPAWSPKQPYLAFTSFREQGSNGDIWLVNLYAARELVETRTAADSLERPMWPVTRGPAADGFPTWSPDAKTILFCRSERDDNGDGVISPSDRSVVWAVDISYLPADHDKRPNPSFRINSSGFFERIAHTARPITSASFNATQPEFGIDGRIYFVSGLKGNQDIFALADSALQKAGNARPDHAGQSTLPLPTPFDSRQVHRLFEFDQGALTAEQRAGLLDRIWAYQLLMDSRPDSAHSVAASLYEIAVGHFLLGEADQCLKHLDFILEHYRDVSEISAFAELLRQGVASAGAASSNNLLLFNALEEIRRKYANDRLFSAKALVLSGDIRQGLGEAEQAAYDYRRVLSDFADFPEICAESLIKLARLHRSQGQLREAFLSFAQVLQNYYAQSAHVVIARDEILAMLTEGAVDDDAQLARYKMIIGQFNMYDLFVIEPFLRIGELYDRRREYDAALRTYDFILAHFRDLPQETFKAALARAETLLKMGELRQASQTLSETAEAYRSTYPQLTAEAERRLTEILYASAKELQSTKNYDPAAARYRQIIEVNPHHILAHQGYIECGFYTDQIDQIIAEYHSAVQKHPEDNILLYAQGLAYSYKGTQAIDNFETAVKSVESLERSNQILQKALALDYNLIEPYLTLSFNYELLENHQAVQQGKPKSFWRKAGGAVTAPLVWLYHTVTFYEETKPPRYYESAIQELTRALALNNEEQHPRREALLALNMANNYYNLGEFGFRKAYEFYHIALRYDSTFSGPLHEALIKERMGHCAIFVNDQERGPLYLKRTIELYGRLNKELRVLLNTKRLALLYELGENSREALSYYLQAAEMEKRMERFDGLLKSYRSAALHYFKMNQPDDAVRYANLALELLESGQVPRRKSNPIYMKLGIFDLYFPFPYDLRKVGAKSTIDISTEEEEAFVYTVLAQVFQDEKRFDEAVEYYQKKFQIYELRHDYDAQAVFQNNMGYLYFLKGDYDNAWRQFTNSYWWCVKTKYIYGQLLNLENAAQVVLTLAREERSDAEANLQKYRNWITNKLQELLRLTRADQSIYAVAHTHFNMLLADLSLLPDGDESPDGTDGLKSSFARLEKTGRAYGYLDAAEGLAQQYGLNAELCGITYRRGDLHLRLGERQQALELYQKARNLALQHRLHDLLWQSDNALAGLLEEMVSEESINRSVRNDPSVFLAEAIRLIESERALPIGLSAARRRKMLQQPYRRMIRRLLDEGNVEGALTLAERMREKTNLDMLERDKLVLRTDEHRTLFTRADSLSREIERLEGEMRQASSSSSAAKIQSERLALVQKEFSDHLSVIRRKAPELEPLVKVSPSIEQAQAQLRSDEAVLCQLNLENRVVLWLIKRNDITVHQLPCQAAQLRSALKQWLTAVRADSIDSASTAELHGFYRSLPLEGIRRLVLIPDYDDMLFPWSALFTVCGLPPLETVSSSLTGYFTSTVNRHAPTQHLETGDNTLAERIRRRSSDPVFMTDEMGGAQNIFFAHKVGPAVLLNGLLEINSTFPSYSRLTFGDQPHPLTPQALYGQTTSASPLVLNAVNLTLTDQPAEAVIAWERSSSYSGATAMLINLWPSADSTDVFYRQFYRNLDDLPPRSALQKTINDLAEQGVPPSYWAGYQLIGAGGERSQDDLFAQAAKWKQSGDRAFRRGQWAEAVSDYSQAMQIVGAQSTAAADSLTERLLASAVNGGIWEVAVKIQNERFAAFSRRNQHDRAAAAVIRLYVYHLLQKSDKAADALQRYRQLCLAYGLEYDDAAPFAETAELYAQGANHEQAVSLYQQAAERYARLGQGRRQVECLLSAGRLLDCELGYSAKSLEVLSAAVALAEKRRLIDLQIEGSTAVGRAYLSLGNTQQALQWLDGAIRTAESQGEPALAQEGRLALAECCAQQGDWSAAQHAVRDYEEYNLAASNRALLMRSRIALGLGDFDQARKYAEQVIKASRPAEDSEAAQTAEELLAMALWRIGNPVEAARRLENAVRLQSGPFARREYLRRMLMLGACHTDAGHYEQAERLAREALPLCRIGHLRDFEPQCLLLLSRTVADSAAFYAQQAVRRAETLYQWPSLLWAHARLAELADSPELAQTHFDKALQASRMIRPQSTRYDYAVGSTQAERHFYQNYLRFLIRQNKPPAALQAADKLRSLSTERAVGQGRPRLRADDQRLINRYLSTYERLNLETSRRFMQKTSSFVSDDSVSTRRSIQQKIDSLKVLCEEIAADRPELYELFFGIDLLPKKIEIPNDRLLLAFCYDDKNLYSWCLNRDGLRLHQSEFSIDEFDRNLQALNQQLERKESASLSARLFYEQLLRPWASQLAAAEHVAIVPFEKLFDVPFAVLMDENNTLLGLQKTLTLHAFASTLQIDGVESPAAFASSSRTVTFSNPRSELISIDLSLTANVAASLARYSDQISHYDGPRATAEKFKSVFVEADMLFIGTEAVLDDAAPLRSALLLTGERGESGKVTLHDLLELNRAPRHLVVSNGKWNVRHDGRALQMTAVLVDYWRINSLLITTRSSDPLTSALLLKRYFRALAEGETPAQALRTARLYIYQNVDAHPSAWASYMLTAGHWAPMPDGRRTFAQ